MIDNKEEAFGIIDRIPNEYGMWTLSLLKLWDIGVGLPRGPRLPDNAVIVELGVHRGRTSALLAYMARMLGGEYHGVDAFILSAVVTEAEYRNTIESFDLPYTLHVGMTNDVAWDKPIDLLVIDASHTEPYITQDCAKWLPFVKPGGYAVFDDWDQPEVIAAGTTYTQGWEDQGRIGHARFFRKPRAR